VAVPRRRAQLSEETQRRIRAQHEDAIERLVAAEALMLRVMRETVQDATSRLVADLAGLEGDPAAVRRLMFDRVQAHQVKLRTDFAGAARIGRLRAKVLANGQVKSELAGIQGWLKAAGSRLRVPEPLDVTADEELAAQDVAESSMAGDSMAGAWSAAALAALMLWLRRGAQRAQMLGSVRGLPTAVDGRVTAHAASHAVDAYEAGRAASWPVKRAPVTPSVWPKTWKQAAASEARAAVRQGLESPARIRRLPPVSPTGEPVILDPSGKRAEPEPDVGLPHGWQAAVFDIWSAILDGKTCPICSGLDGTMVPRGQQFPGGYRPKVHVRCRCEIVSTIIPEALQARIPGVQIDYEGLKADVADYFKGARRDLVGKRHAAEFVRESMAATGGSSEVLLRRFSQRGADVYVDKRYAAKRARQRLRPEPVTRQIWPAHGAGSRRGLAPGQLPE
jgi:hypothetical protein